MIVLGHLGTGAYVETLLLKIEKEAPMPITELSFVSTEVKK